MLLYHYLIRLFVPFLLILCVHFGWIWIYESTYCVSWFNRHTSSTISRQKWKKKWKKRNMDVNGCVGREWFCWIEGKRITTLSNCLYIAYKFIEAFLFFFLFYSVLLNNVLILYIHALWLRWVAVYCSFHHFSFKKEKKITLFSSIFLSFCSQINALPVVECSRKQFSHSITPISIYSLSSQFKDSNFFSFSHFFSYLQRI